MRKGLQFEARGNRSDDVDTAVVAGQLTCTEFA